MTRFQAHALELRLAGLYSASEAVEWMVRRQKLLNDRRPVDCPVEEVQQVVDQLLSGAFI